MGNNKLLPLADRYSYLADRFESLNDIDYLNYQEVYNSIIGPETDDGLGDIFQDIAAKK